MGKQHGEARLVQELGFWLGCLLEVQFAGLRALDAGKCAVFCSCAKTCAVVQKLVQLCRTCADAISSLAV